MKILLTGGGGLLGQELQRLFKLRDYNNQGVTIDAPSKEELDITKPIKSKDYDLIIHAAAYTDVVKAEIEREKCFLVNVFGTYSLAKAYPKAKFVYISSEYVKNSINFYSESKKMAELMVEKICKEYLIIRTSFSPSPFPHKKAFTDQWTEGDYIDVIAPMLLEALFKYMNENRTIDVGTYRKTIYELALRTNPNVGECSVDDIKSVKLPKDYENLF